MSLSTPVISIGFSSRLQNLQLVSSLVRHAGTLVGLAAEELRDLDTAVLEAVSHCIKHTYGGSPDHSIQLQVAVEEETRLVVTVSDFGAASEIDLPRIRISQAGSGTREEQSFFLICSLMDEVEHDANAFGNKVRMVKRLDRAPKASEAVLDSFRAVS